MYRTYTQKFFSLLLIAFCSVATLNAQVQDFILSVAAPASIAGNYDAYGATFGPSGCALDDVVVNTTDVAPFADNGSGVTTACDADGTVMVDATDKVLFLDRGVCGFVEKVANAIPTGAIAVVICSDEPREPTNPGGTDPGDITFASFMISYDDCQTLRMEIANGLNISITKDPEATLSNPNTPDPSEVLFFEDFADGLMGWTTVGISSETTMITADEALWTYDDDGSAPACFGGGAIATNGACTGAALFDFQGYQTAGCTDTNVSSGNLISGELISPSMDLSGTTAIQLNFTQYMLRLNGSNGVAWSTDDGATWSDPLEITTENVLTSNENNVVGTEFVNVAIPQLAGASNARIKFIANDDFYFWMVDDIYVSELTGANASIVETFYTPLSYVFPSVHGDADPFLWQAQVRNNGGVDLIDGTLTVNVTGSAGNVVHTDQIAIDNIELGTVDTININDGGLYLPEGLAPDTYTVTFDASFPGLGDNDPSDNTSSYEFVVSDNYWAKENATEATRGSSRYILAGTTDENWGVGAAYIASPDLATDQAHSIEFSVNSTDGSMQDNFVTVYLLEYADDSSYAFNEDQTFDRTTVDLTNHPDFNVLYRNLLVFDETYVPGTTITLDLVNRPGADPVDDAIVFDPGRGYVVAIQFDNSQGGAAPISNYDLSLGSDASVDGNGLYIFANREDGTNWFTGFTGGTAAPHLRLYRRMFSSNNTPQLAEGAFTVNPNPASDFINLTIELEEASSATLDIAGMDGKIISSQSFSNVQSDTKQIDVANLPNGTYMVRLATDKGSKIHKVVIQH